MTSLALGNCFSILIIFLIAASNHWSPVNGQQSPIYRKNYVLERNETWGDGHTYLVREEQPFFRVYHARHRKVRRSGSSPPAGGGPAEGSPPSGDQPPSESPLEFQLREEQGSDQRLREAAEFWRERNRQLHAPKNSDDAQSLRAKREEAPLPEGRQLDLLRGAKEREKISRTRKEDMPSHIVDKEFKLDIQFDSNNIDNGDRHPSTMPADEAPQMEVLKRNQSRAEAIFGHHHLPKGEVKDTARWPWQIWPYMHCLTLECICPLYRGNVVGHECILPNGKPLKRAVRKEFRTYTPKELALFMETMRRFKASGLYTRFGMIHRRSGVHSGPSFFPWHREFMKRLEIVFRAMHPENTEPVLGLPYWDSTLDHNLPAPEDSVIFSEFLLGEPDEAGFVTNGLFANWTTMDGRHAFQRMFGDQPDGEFVNEARIDWVKSQNSVDRVMAFSLPLHGCLNYEMDDRFLEYSHDYTHYFISGDMQERFSSSNDPIFMMHHSFIDSIWEMWRQSKQTRLQRETDYPRDEAECMPEWHFSYAFMPLLQPMRNMDVLSNNYTDHMFEYAPRPNCEQTGNSADCGNTEFLFCDTKSHVGHPVCAAKIKPGGNCAGFEWSAEVCVRGQCVKGRCIRNQNPPPSNDAQNAKKVDGTAPKLVAKMDTAGLSQMDIASDGWHPISFMRR